MWVIFLDIELSMSLVCRCLGGFIDTCSMRVSIENASGFLLYVPFNSFNERSSEHRSMRLCFVAKGGGSVGGAKRTRLSTHLSALPPLSSI